MVRRSHFILYDAYHRRAIDNGARELAPLARRSWGHDVAYSIDPDDHVLAFAREG